jgi:hypothetical protein
MNTDTDMDMVMNMDMIMNTDMVINMDMVMNMDMDTYHGHGHLSWTWPSEFKVAMSSQL